MRRREFIVALAGAAAWPADAQQPVLIGFLSSRSARESEEPVRVLAESLKGHGYVENQNVAIEYRWAEGEYGRLPLLAADLVRRGVAVIVTGGGNPAALAAKGATTVVPIVFVSGSDPVTTGLVASLNSPGGNVTGVSLFAHALNVKRLELLHQLVPRAGAIGVLLNPDSPTARQEELEVEVAARAMGLRVIPVHAKSDGDFEAAFSHLIQQNVGALVVSADAFFLSRRVRLVELASQHRLPSAYQWRQFAEAGGLVSYGASDLEGYRQAGTYVARILQGAKPSDIPVQQPTRFELVINSKTATALGLPIPPNFLARADGVIE